MWYWEFSNNFSVSSKHRSYLAKFKLNAITLAKVNGNYALKPSGKGNKDEVPILFDMSAFRSKDFVSVKVPIDPIPMTSFLHL